MTGGGAAGPRSMFVRIRAASPATPQRPRPPAGPPAGWLAYSRAASLRRGRPSAPLQAARMRAAAAVCPAAAARQGPPAGLRSGHTSVARLAPLPAGAAPCPSPRRRSRAHPPPRARPSPRRRRRRRRAPERLRAGRCTAARWGRGGARQRPGKTASAPAGHPPLPSTLLALPALQQDRPPPLAAPLGLAAPQRRRRTRPAAADCCSCG
jgi:hypothetical protein